MKAIRAVASGRVQGVGFRWFVREAARRIGVDGWVRNCADGTVEVLAAGPPESVDSLVLALRRGPSAAHVEELNVLPAEGEVAPHPFTVRQADTVSSGALARSILEGDVRRTIREVPDFPKPGILFKDITPVLADAELYRRITDAMAEPFVESAITHVVAVESRGFLLAGPIARRLGAGLVPVRKPGKLPFDVVRQEYALEYGTDCLEMHRDALSADSRVLIVDDVLATGGTARAASLLAERHARQVVGCSFLLELADLGGRAALAGRTVSAVLTV